MRLVLLSFLFFSMPAEAGKLDAGWRGIPYGDPSVLDTAPGSSCVASPERGVRWTCTETVGEAQIEVNYMVVEGLYGGVFIQCAGFTTCRTLFEAVSAAWAVPFSKQYPSDTSSLPDGFFNLKAARSEGVVGAWTYNRFSGEGQLTTVDMKIQARQKAIREARATSAAQGL
jgi:hypothetical protein